MEDGTVYFMVGRPDVEWDKMWALLGEEDINKDNPSPTVCYNNGENWQYMGTWSLDVGKWYHSFRHRCHPNNRNDPVTINILVTPVFKEYIYDGLYPLDDRTKMMLFDRNNFTFTPPAVPAVAWNKRDWIKYIDKNGSWMI